MNIYLKIKDDILKHKQSVIGVAERPIFCYTIGNAALGLPELLMIGNLPLDQGTVILNVLGEKMRTQRSPLTGEVSLGGGYPLRARQATDAAKSRYTIQAGQYHETEDYVVTQILIPDTLGLFPDEPGINPRYEVPLV